MAAAKSSQRPAEVDDNSAARFLVLFQQQTISLLFPNASLIQKNNVRHQHTERGLQLPRTATVSLLLLRSHSDGSPFCSQRSLQRRPKPDVDCLFRLVTKRRGPGLCFRKVSVSGEKPPLWLLKSYEQTLAFVLVVVSFLFSGLKVIILQHRPATKQQQAVFSLFRHGVVRLCESRKKAAALLLLFLIAIGSFKKGVSFQRHSDVNYCTTKSKSQSRIYYFSLFDRSGVVTTKDRIQVDRTSVSSHNFCSQLLRTKTFHTSCRLAPSTIHTTMMKLAVFALLFS